MASNPGTKGLADGTSSGGDRFASSHNNGAQPIYQRAVVHEVIFDPQVLSDDQIDKIKQQIRFTENVRNIPPNSIVAERIRTGHTEISGRELFFPFFPPHLALPVKPGEQVWIMFEDPGMTDTQGFWMCRISEVRSVDDVNHTHADRKFDRRVSKKTSDKATGAAPPSPAFNNGVLGILDGVDANIKGTASISGGPDAYKNILVGDSAAHATAVIDYESVPRFRKRPGDFVAQGSNNTMLVLGTDRTGAADTAKDGAPADRPASDQKVGAGTAIISVGRGQKPKTSGKKIKNALGRDEIDKSTDKEDISEGDFDFENDSTTLFLSMKTSADKNFKVKHKKLIDTSSSTSSAAIIKSDQVRIIARQDIKFLVKATDDTPDDEAAAFVIKKNGDIVFIPSAKGVIKLGGDDADMALLGTHVGVSNASGKVSASPIIDTMGGAQGGSDGLNGVFASKILAK